MAGTKNFIAGCSNVNVDLLFSGMPRMPKEGEEIYAQAFSLQLGGGIPGTMVNVGRLGIPVHLQTGLGTDQFSTFARETFRKVGIEPKNICLEDKGIPVNLSVAAITPTDRTFISYTDPFKITDEVLETVYQESTGAKVCAMDIRFLEVYKKLKEEGTILVLDTGWDDNLSIENYKEALMLADYYTPNQKEALKITNTSSPEAAADVLCGFFDKVIVKLDSNGCLIDDQGKRSVIPVIPEYAELYVDSTGAGDAFLAGLLYGIYHDKTLAQSVLYGTLTGGKCVTGIGCLSAYHTEETLNQAFDKYQSLID